ncbi:lysozyme [Pseudosulfitobacter pseudonitzschiae]|nr:lysozyme [Pseudosulfitobacter pseudonitzschiae]MCI2217035.1 lysozyme [Pseudosulfitobacter pseudonitzschiae]UFE30636.1 lysozyme [Pseudosulfitobacter pseudonitzschiae]UFE39904.1 lysozyme [Pseudosulfitobacter pseudonitzschiae]UFE49188.1 lysozyme [Pseudosulfitobacter pseudonitzschiae]UFE63315.1 lysozyme [Pseudosulfitobacter pseudonitzschiae]
MILGFIAFIGSEALYLVWRIEADPYPLGLAALVFFVAGFVGRFIKQDAGSAPVRRTLFRLAFGFGVIMLVKSLGGAVYEDAVLPDPAPISGEQAMRQGTPERLTLAMADKPMVPKAAAASSLASEAEFLRVAIPFVAKWEGLRLVAYRDIVGVWTICFGETKGVKAGDVRTQAECEVMLARELIIYRNRMHGYFTADTLRARLPVYRDTAFTDLGYNVGTGAAGTSTAVRRLNAGLIADSCEAITWYNKAGGRVWRGLVLRRTDDFDYCMKGLAA